MLKIFLEIVNQYLALIKSTKVGKVDIEDENFSDCLFIEYWPITEWWIYVKINFERTKIPFTYNIKGNTECAWKWTRH